MKFTRRNLGTFAAFAVGASTLAGCSLINGNPLNTSVTVNLATAQAEAQAIYQAFGSFVSLAESSVSSSISGEISSAYSALGTAVTAFGQLTSGSATVNQVAQEVIGLIGQILPLIPATILPGPTGAAISLGLLLLSAFISGLSTITVPAAAVVTPPASLVRAKQVIIAPIPIPLS
jgi:hypothetical protein